MLASPAAGAPGPVRGAFKDIIAVGTTLAPVGTVDAPARPLALLGGDFLSAFSVEIGFAAPEITFWDRQPASDGFLSAGGHAVLRVGRYGAGELEARGPENTLGERGPYQYPASILVLRACAAPETFAREQPLPTACCRGEERQNATGTDVALALGTGVGPVVLSRTAWNRIQGRLPSPAPAPVDGPLQIATATDVIPAAWSRLPRLALVDREAAADDDPGPCAELGRSRRLEQVAFRQVMNPELAACALPCDRDRRNEGIAQNSAGYIELAGEIDVAIVADESPLLQSLRARVRPNGPEVDGILGAAALRDTRVELDYQGQPTRTIFTCERGVPLDRCRTVSRCPRLPGRGPTRACFGLPAHGLPRMCDNQVSTCG